jgi:hypothetical protein
VHDKRLSNALNGLWGKFHGFTQRANALIIHQNLVLAACHIKCFVDVKIVFLLLMYESNHIFQGWGDVQLPQGFELHEHARMRLPLFLALAVSPLMLLAPVQWHTKDFNRSSLVGVSHESSVIMSYNICNIDMAMPGKSEASFHS